MKSKMNNQMEESFSGLGSKVFCFAPDNGRVVEIDIEAKNCNIIMQRDEERRIDRLISTPPEVTILERHRSRRFSGGSRIPRLPRRIKKATTRGRNYKRDTRWKRKASILARRSWYMKHHLKDMKLTMRFSSILLSSRGMGKSAFYNKKPSQ